MADTHSDRLGLIGIEEGTRANEWGDLLNLNFERLDSAVRGYIKITLAGAETLDSNDITTTASIAQEESFFQFIEFAGTAGTVTVPAENIMWIVYNNSDGDFTFQPAGGTGVTLTQGSIHFVIYGSNGTTFTDVTTLINRVNITGTPANDQIAVWTAADTIEGSSALTYDGSTLATTADITLDKTGNVEIYNTNNGSTLTFSSDDLGGTKRITMITGGSTPNVDLYYSGTPVFQTVSGGATTLGNAGVTQDIVITEQADHSSTPAAGFGYVWVKDDTPNTLMFTDDAGNDIDLTTVGSVTASGTPVDNQIAVWTSASNVEGAANLVYDTTAGATDLVSITNIAGQTSGRVLEVTSNLSTKTAAVCGINQNHASSTANALNITNSGTGVSIDLSGKGHIKFPATASPSTDANTLDDYQEGEWTATLVPNTGTITLSSVAETLAYTKIGRVVHITGRISLTGVSSPTGEVQLQGLPFTNAALTDQAEDLHTPVYATNLVTDPNGFYVGTWNGPDIAIVKQDLTNINAELQNLSTLAFNFFYFTDQ